MVRWLWKIVQQLLIKSNIPINNPTPRYLLKQNEIHVSQKDLHMNTHSSLVHYSPKPETTPIHRQVNGQANEQPYNGKLLSVQRNELVLHTTRMNLTDRRVSYKNQTRRNTYVDSVSIKLKKRQKWVYSDRHQRMVTASQWVAWEETWENVLHYVQ